MINLLIFDLDGVLVDTEALHYNSLVQCITEVTSIPIQDIESVIHQDGTTTKLKLLELKKVFRIPDTDLQIIDHKKQKIVLKNLQSLKPNREQIDMLTKLELLVPVLAIGSNSRKENVDVILNALNIKEFFSYVVTSEDVLNSKPDPEIFNTIMNMAGCKANNTLILEDSAAGKTAAILSGAHLLPINNIRDTTLVYIQNALYEHDTYNSGTNGRARITIC